ncbi:DEKNAAC101132 [Brettanomyces naardenensis]|uniref:DEKNAAC101132 n=1 Tax=Brettanomyces naardenensis TaxID=13370 RepID=A0A448YHA2_BRENA|nr:DEKNAAC101132 [Brettanomyces naardenensis]
MISIYFASKLGPEYLAACSLSITTFYLSGPVIFNGFSTALDTLCSTAFGAGHYRKVGLYYQRCTVILLFALLPISVFWLNAGPVLAAMTSEKKLVTLCEQYLRLMPLAAPAVVIFECSKRYLQSQYKFTVPTRITILALPLSFILNTKFLSIFKFQGPPLAFIITYWFMCISLLLYIFFIDGYQCWRPNTTIRQLFSDWSPFFRLGIPGVLMIMSEAFAFQILTILSTRFGLDELAAQSVVSTLASFAFQLPFSVGICCSTRIANIIGGRSSNHKVAIPVTIGVACFLSYFNFAWMVAFRYPLAKQFSDDNELISKVCHLFLVVGFNQFLDCINILCAAILRGQGRQRIGSSLSLFSYYIIATPFELLLGFYYDMKVFGLWLGLALGVSFLSISELIVVLRSDWDSIMRKSAEIV